MHDSIIIYSLNRILDTLLNQWINSTIYTDHERGIQQ